MKLEEKGEDCLRFSKLQGWFILIIISFLLFFIYDSVFAYKEIESIELNNSQTFKVL